jgi:serine/threonine-protein kinase
MPDSSPSQSGPQLPADLPEPRAVVGGSSRAEPTLRVDAPGPHATDVATRRIADEEPGETFGKYRLLRRLGRGGMGTVYQARDTKLNLEVALKRITAGRLADDQDVRRFYSEAELAAGLSHPDIVRIYEVDEQDGEHYLSMELVAGGSLVDRLPEYAADTPALLRMMAAVCRAVHYAHQRQVLHCDLKPANILLDRDGRPRLTDFGVARRLRVGGSAESDVVEGTPAYMAPEQADGRPTTASDVYSLGVILYELLAGRTPYDGESWKQVLARVVTGQPPPPAPAEVRAGVDADLNAICLKATARDPQQRYGSAQALAEDLERRLAGEPVQARPVGRLERVRRWCRCKPAAAAATAAAALLAVGLGVSAVVVARARHLSLQDEVLRANLYAAQGVAATVLWELEHLSRPVLRQADDDRIRRLAAARDSAGLRRALSDIQSAYPPGGSPYESWFVLDQAGTVLAHDGAGAGGAAVGSDHSGRDYFLGAARRADEAGRQSVYVSRVFRADTDGPNRFAVSAPIRAGPQRDAPVVGFLFAAVAGGPTLGDLDLSDDTRVAALIARRDADAKAGESADDYVLLFHPAYKRGDTPVSVAHHALRDAHRPRGRDEFQLARPVSGVGADEYLNPDYFDPTAARDPRFAGEWLAAFAPVGNTDFLVVVQQREIADAPGTILLVGGAVLAVAVAAAAAWGVRR